MKFHLLSILSFAALALLAPLHADDAGRIAKLGAIDDQRVAAMKSANQSQMAAIFSDELRYAHSNGVVDNKTSLSETISAGKTKYVSYDYEERNFTFPVPGIALMTGRAHVQAETGGGKMDSVLGFLAVWRKEGDQWRFLSWQSCKLPPAAPAAAK